MFRRWPAVVLAGLVGLAVWAPRAPGQPPAGTAGVLPNWTPETPALTRPVAVPQGPGAVQEVPPPPPPPPDSQIPPPPPLIADPFGPRVTPPGGGAGHDEQPGLFGSLEIGLVGPQINGTLTGTAPVNGFNRPVQLNAADLDWTGSPRFELGYRFPGGAGSVIGVYRLVASDGTENIPNFHAMGDGFARTRLNLNSIDVSYASPEIPFAPLWALDWELGVRIGAVYYDTTATGVQVQQKVRNQFVGAGPHFAFEVQRQFEYLPQLALVGRLDGAVVIGGVDQSFEQTNRLPGGTLLGGARDVSETQSVPVLALEFGLRYAPAHQKDWLRFTFGYHFEEWYGVGDAGESSGDVLFHGFFFRGELKY